MAINQYNLNRSYRLSVSNCVRFWDFDVSFGSLL